MKRVMLTVAYDGTNYHGWQVQANGETIEGILNRCLSELLGEDDWGKPYRFRRSCAGQCCGI